MDIVQRGNPSVMKRIQQEAKQVSEMSGISEETILTPKTAPVKSDIPNAGAFASLQSMKSPSITEQRPASSTTTRITESGAEKRLKERLLESVETLGVTREYYNATSSLLTLYAMGSLTEGVLDTISREDMREIKGIVKEFKGKLDCY